MHPIAHPRRLVVVVIVCLAVLVGACTAATPSPTPVPTPTLSVTPTTVPGSIVPVASEPAAASLVVTGAEVCADLAAFQASIDTLQGLDPSTAGVAGVLRSVGGAISTGTALVDSARAVFGPETQALGAALSDLQAALAGITDDGTLLDKAATIENAIDDVAAAFDALKAELAPGCPSPSPSGG
jgi:predicted trehalose synthase